MKEIAKELHGRIAFLLDKARHGARLHISRELLEEMYDLINGALVEEEQARKAIADHRVALDAMAMQTAEYVDRCAALTKRVEELERAASGGGEAPRCPSCGYTNKDCRELMDHHLCSMPDPPSTHPAPAVPKPQLLALTALEIADLAAHAGLMVAPPDSDQEDVEYIVTQCPADGIKDDFGRVEHFELVAYSLEYPEEGSIPLGKALAAAPSPKGKASE